MFSYKSARSGAVLFALLLVITIEVLALHLWLRQRYPVLSWTLVAISIASIPWLIADYRARGTRQIRLEGAALLLSIGLRPQFTVALSAIASAEAAQWRTLPRPDERYANLTAPAQPNVILTLREPTAVPLGLGIRKRVVKIGLHLDEPEAFLKALGQPAAAV